MNEFLKTILQALAGAIIMFLIFWSIVAMANNIYEDRCEEAGGTYKRGGNYCHKVIDGEYVQGKTIELNGEWVFVRT